MIYASGNLRYVSPHIRCWRNANDGIGFCIHVSGSAYKIVNKRAYHHGTMLISSELGTLGKLLHSNKVPKSRLAGLGTGVNTSQDTMQTKGVASVRSPVCNLRQHKPDVSHEDFVHAVVRQFQDHYNIREMVETFLCSSATCSPTRPTED